MDIVPNKNSIYNFDFVLFDFVSDLEVCDSSYNYDTLDRLGKSLLRSIIKVGEDYYEIVDYQVGKGGYQSHKYSLGFGVNKIMDRGNTI